MSKRRSINFAKRVAESFRGSGLDRNGIVRQLKAEGWKQLGRGAFAIVLEHPNHNHVVIKVGCIRSSNKNAREEGLRDGFHRYVDFLRDSYSKMALKVYGDLVWSGDNYVAVIERLYKINGNTTASKAITGAAHEIRWSSSMWRRVKASPQALRFFTALQWHGRLDVHPGNIMQRADGTIVVTDPLTIPGASYA